jgi:hypothetical protein
MRRRTFVLALGLAPLALAACTPFFYGGVVILGPADTATAAAPEAAR